MSSEKALASSAPRRRSQWAVVYWCFVAGIGGLVVVVLWPFIEHFWMIPSRHAAQFDLNHEAIRDAARGMMDSTPEGSIGMRAIAADPGIPAPIRELYPAYIIVHRDEVRIEFIGGFDHYGLIVCRDEGPPRFGGLRIIDGVYYYSE